MPKVAIIGDGQLARMLVEPAAALAIDLVILAGEANASAAQVANFEIGDYRDFTALAGVVKDCQAVTFDHEHVPTEHLQELAKSVPVRPSSTALLFAQDKIEMREKLQELQLPIPKFARVTDTASAQEFIAAVGFPIVLKTPRGGYDGNGVWVVTELTQITELIEKHPVLLAEEFVPFKRELSALVARNPSDDLVAWPIVQSTQTAGVCSEVIAPAPELSSTKAAQAEMIAKTIARQLDVVGVLAVELFETETGELLVNELAMRPHNTGHWTQDGAVTSQFENHLRAVLDLPLGATAARQPWTVMGNILGTDATGERLTEFATALQDPNLKVHLYGKSARPGRKLGHVTAYGTDLTDCLTRVRQAVAWFSGKE